MVLDTYPHDLVASTLDRDSVDVTSPFIRIIINKATYLFLHCFRMLDIPQDHLTGSPGSDKEDML